MLPFTCELRLQFVAWAGNINNRYAIPLKRTPHTRTQPNSILFYMENVRPKIWIHIWVISFPIFLFVCLTFDRSPHFLRTHSNVSYLSNCVTIHARIWYMVWMLQCKSVKIFLQINQGIDIATNLPFFADAVVFWLPRITAAARHCFQKSVWKLFRACFAATEALSQRFVFRFVAAVSRHSKENYKLKNPSLRDSHSKPWFWFDRFAFSVQVKPIKYSLCSHTIH